MDPSTASPTAGSEGSGQALVPAYISAGMATNAASIPPADVRRRPPLFVHRKRARPAPGAHRPLPTRGKRRHPGPRRLIFTLNRGILARPSSNVDPPRAIRRNPLKRGQLIRTNVASEPAPLEATTIRPLNRPHHKIIQFPIIASGPIAVQVEYIPTTDRNY